MVSKIYTPKHTLGIEISLCSAYALSIIIFSNMIGKSEGRKGGRVFVLIYILKFSEVEQSLKRLISPL